MTKALELVGQKFGRLTVLKRNVQNNKHGQSRWDCVCECGGFITSVGTHLKDGHTKSCGCLVHDMLMERNTTHNKSKTVEHRHWCAMIGRCKEESTKKESYFDRGIFVEEYLLDFENFLSVIGKKPKDNKRWSVGRIDNNKPYTRDNIRWELDHQQVRNRTKYKTNKSGIVGVYHRPAKGAMVEMWVGEYEGLDGKPRSKAFSVNKWGFEKAKQLAIEFREDGIKLLNSQGAGYTPSHGSDK